MPTTDAYEGLLAETTAVHSAKGDLVHAYFARPLGPGPFPGMVLLHHRPGWDEWYRQVTRRFAHHGYLAICPDLFCRFGHGEPDDVAARAIAKGDVHDEDVVADTRGCVDLLRALPNCTGKIGLFGTCSGGGTPTSPHAGSPTSTRAWTAGADGWSWPPRTWARPTRSHRST